MTARVLLLALLTAACARAASAPAPPAQDASGGASAVASDAPAPGAAPAAPRAAAPTVKIIFVTVPMTKATVNWGKKRLGFIVPRHPLVVERPRDSGPLDVVVRAEGCLPVQTRAYTFGDNKVSVKVTPIDQRNTLLGYREEVPQDGGAPDGGAASARALGPDGGVR